NLELRQLDLLPCGDCRNADGETTTEAGQHDFARGRGRVFTKEVPRLVDNDGRMIANIAEGAVLPLHDGVDVVLATSAGVVAAFFGEGQQAVAVDRAQVGGDGLSCFGGQSWLLMERCR